MRMTFTSRGIGSGRNVAVGTKPSCSPIFSMRTSPLLSARLRASHVRGLVSTSRTCRIKNPPLAWGKAPALIIVKSVVSAPNSPRYSTLPTRL